jgi:DNA-binding CsgD family transcriptional regulator
LRAGAGASHGAPRGTAVAAGGRIGECLKYFVEGRTSAFAAKAMKVSEATIRFHTRNLCAKTGAANRAQLAAIAIVRGLVQNEDKKTA